jgi:hypothetical protein
MDGGAGGVRREMDVVASAGRSNVSSSSGSRAAPTTIHAGAGNLGATPATIHAGAGNLGVAPATNHAGAINPGRPAWPQLAARPPVPVIAVPQAGLVAIQSIQADRRVEERRQDSVALCW